MGSYQPAAEQGRPTALHKIIKLPQTRFNKNQKDVGMAGVKKDYSIIHVHLHIIMHP